MKLTTKRLKQLIREELNKTLNENIYSSGQVAKFQQGFMKYQDDEEALIKHISEYAGTFMGEYIKSDAKWLNSKAEDLESFGMRKAAQYMRKHLEKHSS